MQRDWDRVGLFFLTLNASGLQSVDLQREGEMAVQGTGEGKACGEPLLSRAYLSYSVELNLVTRNHNTSQMTQGITS